MTLKLLAPSARPTALGWWFSRPTPGKSPTWGGAAGATQVSIPPQLCRGCPPADSHGEVWGTEGPWCQPQLGSCLASGSWQVEVLQRPWPQHMLPWASRLIELSSRSLAPLLPPPPPEVPALKHHRMGPLTLWTLSFLQISAVVLRILESASTPPLHLPQVPTGANTLTEF